MDTITLTLTEKQQQFIAAYFEAVCFTEELEMDEIDSLWVEKQTIECLCFYNATYFYFPEGTIEQAGCDFWLTRNGHGTGFWDRPEIYGDVLAEKMTKRAEAFGWGDIITNEEVTYE